MAFQQVTVENRVSEFPNRRTLTKEDNTTEIVTVTRNEGNVSTEGTAWGAAYANDLESRINTETNLLETNFGHVETNTTASKSYSVGETLVLNGQMYKVTAAIAQGATLVVGTNIAVHSVSAINSNMSGLTFAQNTDGKWGYKVAGADPVIPFSKGSELLWTNPAPVSGFAAQTIALDLSKYKYVAIRSQYANSSYLECSICTQPVPSQDATNGNVTPIVLAIYNSSAIAYRSVTVTTSGITFSTGLKVGGSSDPGWCIPLKIYGFAEGLA